MLRCYRSDRVITEVRVLTEDSARREPTERQPARAWDRGSEPRVKHVSTVNNAALQTLYQLNSAS